MARGLTEQQKRFIDAYLSDENLSIPDAAERAGYGEAFQVSGAYQLLRNPKIAAAIDKQMAARARRTRITKDRVLREIASIAFSNIDDYEIDEAGRVTLRDGADVRAMKAVSNLKRTITFDRDGCAKIVTEIKLWDKGAAQDKLARHLNMFKEDQEAGAVRVLPYSEEREALAKQLIGVSDDQEEK